MRRNGMWSHWSGGVIATIVACAFCAGVGVTVADARSSPWSPAIRRAAATVAEPVSARARRARSRGDIRPQARRRRCGARRTRRGRRPCRAPDVGAGHDPDGHPYRWRARIFGNAMAVARTAHVRLGVPRSRRGVGTVGPDRTIDLDVPYTHARRDRRGDSLSDRRSHRRRCPADRDPLQPLHRQRLGARADVVDHFTVTESRPVPGGWHWFSNDELHLRPETFWPVGDKVTVTSDLNGWNVGNGLWGDGKLSAHFAIGDAHVAVANLTTDQMTVSDNGRPIATYPFSGGRAIYPTMNGIHIVLDRENVVHMVSSTNGIPVNSPGGYDELVYADVHITDSGEYVHAAPWSVASQGRANVSHGCINLSPANALAFFAFSRVGDIVDVLGGPRPPAAGDHGVMDWGTPWNQWTPATIHAITVQPPMTHRDTRSARRGAAAARSLLAAR